MATRYLNDLKIEEGDLQLQVGSNAAPQSYDKIHIGGDGLASSDAAIYIGNRGDGSGYGYRMYYYGTGSGNNNKLIFKSENLGNPVDMLSFTADGNATFSGTITTGSHGTSANWKQAYDNYITGIGVSGTSTKTITLTQRDGGTITTTFTDLEGSGGGIDMTNGSNNRVVTAVDSDTVNAEAGLLFGGSYLEITPGNIATPLQVKRTSASTRQVNLLLSANDGTTTSEGFLGIDSGADLRYGASSNTSTNSLVLTEDNLNFTEGDGIKITGTVPTPTISVNYDTGDADNLILAASSVTSITGGSYGAYMLVAESNPGLAQGPVNKIRVSDIHLDDFGAAEGTINLGSNRIINLAAPQTATDAVNRTYADTKVSRTGDTMTGDLSFSSSGVVGFGKIHYGVNGTMGQTTSWNPNNNNPGLWIESDNNESGGVFMNGNTFALWSPGDDDVLKIYDEDSLPTGTPKFKITGAGVAVGYTGFSSDANAKNYTWRALENTGSSSNQYYRIARVVASQSSRFIIELAGRSSSYSDTSLPAFGKIVGQLNNDNNYDIVYYNASAADEVVDEVGQVDINTSTTDIYVRVGTFAELVATASISDGTIIPYDTNSGSTSAPTNYVQATEYKLWNQGNDGANSGLDADLLDGQQGTYYLDYNNFTNTPTIPSTSNLVTTNTTQTISGAKTFSTRADFTANESIRLKGARGQFTGEYIHLYNKVGIGHPSGWGQGNSDTPNYGLSTYGAANFAYGNNATSTFYGDVTTSGHYYGRYVNGEYSNIYRMGGIYFTWDSDTYGTNFNHSITSTDNGTYGDDITINSYGKVRINIDSNNNGTDVFQVGSHTTGTGGNTWFTIKDSGGITMNDNGNTVNGTYALAVNQNTTASSLDAFACGENTTASGRQAFAGGYNTTASGAGSFAIGGNSVASGANSLCAGGDGTATNSATTSIGTLNDATGGHSFAAGYNSTASGLVSFAMGSGATASGPKATAFGEGNGAGGELDFVIGAYNTSTSNLAYGNFISGYDNNVHSSGGGSSSLNIVGGTLNEIGTTSMSMSSGDLNLVLGGENNIGFWQPPGVSTLTTSAADRNIVQGQQNNVLGSDSLVVGRYCLSAKGNMQSAIGFGLVTPLGSTTGQVPNINDGNPQFIVGRHNAFSASTGYMHLFAVGNGGSDSNRFNSFNVLSSTAGTARVGIGRTEPVYVLDVSGQARLSGGYTTSDERLKENIQDNTLGLSELKQLRTVSYDWKSGETLGQNFEDIDANKNCRGLIAQEAELVSADLVETDTSEHAIKSINQGAITAMLIKAVQEQQDIIESLKERIETLENN